MALAIISAAERMASTTVKGMVWGKAGTGKTTLLKTLDPSNTLTLDFEGGMLAVQRDDQFGPAWQGDSIKIENWQEAKAVLQAFQAKQLPKYKTVFIDSISVATKQCFDWALTQPEAWSDKKQRQDTLGAYGLIGRECVEWCQAWKHLDGVNVWMIGGLERKEVEGVKDWMPLTVGAKLANELPYIMDFNLVLSRFKAGPDQQTHVGIFTNPILNPEYASVPLKTRVTGLDQIEPPHLGRLMAKAGAIQAAVTAPPPSSVSTALGEDASATPKQSEAA